MGGGEGGELGDYRGPRCFVERKGVSNSGDPHMVLGTGECEEEPFGAGRGLGPGKSPGSNAKHPFFWVQGCNPAVCQSLETGLEGSRWLRVVPTTAAPRWAKAARTPRTWGGGWVRAARRQAREELQAVW